MNEPSGTRPLILGTRGSDLALAQAVMTRAALEEATNLSLDTRIIKTTGDRRQDLRLRDFAKQGADGAGLDKGIFTKELEEALRAGEIDVAVHSLKDVPSELDEGFVIAGVLPRAPIEDVLIMKEPGGLEGLPEGAKVATGSVRRERLLRHIRPDLEIVEIRGNVPTRIRKLVEQDELSAVLLARAGLVRLGQSRLEEGIVSFDGRELPAEILDCAVFPPAAGQGVVGLEIRDENSRAAEAIAAINHRETFQRATAERAFLLLLQAGCQTPVGVHTWVDGPADAKTLHMKAILFSEIEPESEPKTGKVEGRLDDPGAVAQSLLDSLA